ncbi:MAG: hypothetical protein QXS02_04345 [Candidatus Thermoplasmatota archaeon]
MNEIIIILLSYTTIGAGLKYIDDAFDEQTFNKHIALAMAPLIAILWVYNMIIDPISATILLAIMIGVLIKGKIDNYGHAIGLTTIIILVLIAGIQVLWLPLLMIISSVVLDEVGNDVIDYNRNNLKMSNIQHRLIVTFFDQRWLTKITVLYLVLLGIAPWYFFSAIFFFDSAYLLVRMYSHSISKTKVATN